MHRLRSVLQRQQVISSGPDATVQQVVTAMTRGHVGALPIVGTERMVELIVADAPKTRDEYEQRVEAIRRMAEGLAAGAVTEEERLVAAGTLTLAEALAAEADGFGVMLPDVLMSDRLDVVGSERSMTVLGYASPSLVPRGLPLAVGCRRPLSASSRRGS